MDENGNIPKHEIIAKAVLRRICITATAYIIKDHKLTIQPFTLRLDKEQTKPKTRRWNEIRIRTEINRIEKMTPKVGSLN